MSIEAMTWALSADVGDPTRKLALVGWANHAHKDGRNTWASHATIAEYVGCSTKTIGRAVKILMTEGWIREGDQTQVAHIRPDRRPIVYDLAMSEQQRREWEALYAAADDDEDAHENDGVRVDSLSPREDETGGQPVAPSDDHDQTHGGTHGGTPVSYKDSGNGTQEIPPTPAKRGSCSRHRTTPGDCCRACGTTPRQLEAERVRQVAERDRAAATAAFAADRERRDTRAVPLPPGLKDQTRSQIRANQRRTA